MSDENDRMDVEIVDSPSPNAEDAEDTEISPITIIISHGGQVYDVKFAQDATITELMNEIEASMDIPISHQKIIAPKHPLIKAPLKNPDQPLMEFQGKKLILMGSTAATAEAVQKTAEKVAQRNAARMANLAIRPKKSSKKRLRNKVDATYTFLQVKALQWLPNPDDSQKLLMRLKADPGIVATMKKHKFTVALLTEMEPLANTQSSHEGTSRILGLNRNKGEVIELRLRTDAHDGYRDYKTIRKTLCHELAHNVHQSHDRQFWDLCHQIEREVQAADWKSGGHTIGESSRYAISGQEEEDDHEDEGGWQGGEFVLGGIRDGGSEMTRRQILAKAAEERLRRQTEEDRKELDRQRRSRQNS